MMLKQKTIIFISLWLLVFFFACTDHENAIYYYIENESELAKDAFSEGMSINGMVKGAGHTYIAAGPSMWTRSNTSGWVKVRMPSGAENSQALALLGTTLYVGCNNGLFSTTDIEGQTSPSWTSVAAFAGKQVTAMKIVNSVLFVSVYAAEKGSLYYESTGSFTAVNINGSTELAGLLIADVAHDGTNYWAIAGNNLYSGGSASTMSVADKPTTSADFTGIIYTKNSYYYVSTAAGQIYYSNGGTWELCNNGAITVSEKNVPFRRFAQIPRQTGNGIILVGSNGYGYYTSPDTANTDTPSFSRASDFTVQQLYSGVVDDFFIDTASETVYALTHGSGIWKNGYDDTTGGFTDDTWEQE